MISTVLVIDDSKSSRALNVAYVCNVLGPETRCIEAAGGEEAMAILKTQSVDLVLLDLTMPGMSGYDVLTEVQRHKLSPRIIVISADIQRQTRERVTALGAIAFVEKPVQQDALRALLVQLGASHE